MFLQHIDQVEQVNVKKYSFPGIIANQADDSQPNQRTSPIHQSGGLTTMKQILIFTFCTLLMLLPLNVTAVEQPGTITVSGSATRTLPANFAKIHTRFMVIADNPESSHAAVISDLTGLTSQLSELGIAPKNMIASAITQGPQYEWQDKRKILKGYYSACSLQIKVDDMDSIRAVYRIFAGHTSLTVNHTEYGRTDRDVLENKILVEAFAKARTRAELIANSAASNLGRVLSIVEAGTVQPEPRPLMAARAEAATPQATMGSVTITGTVNASFSLTPSQ